MSQKRDLCLLMPAASLVPACPDLRASPPVVGHAGWREHLLPGGSGMLSTLVCLVVVGLL